MTRPERDGVQRQLTTGEQRALMSFLAGRLPAGQLDAELARARATPAVMHASYAPQASLRAA